ncbi:MAG: hypothetical protein HQL20_01030 [Candidatus Omnitrophica bacterium]|nr:hypothetical protein [Candidatus Omnitrophota bacterium]
MAHTFHIPVMGTGFTTDSPIRVARYGISSVISLVDDNLIEDVRKFYAQQYGEPYEPIKKHDNDWRARRITEYLNLSDRIIQKQIAGLKNARFEPGSEINKYFDFLPETSPAKELYRSMLSCSDTGAKALLQEKLRAMIAPGRIDVNIMTKIDRLNFAKTGEVLPDEHSDALSALRGYANSTVTSAIVLSAGFNRRLYTYIEEFADFYPDARGIIKKEIILKVSDYRSAITQGKFLTRKGLWVSEFRVESGLNCGGHAFAGSGYLMGPILEEFKQRKQELIDQLGTAYLEALKAKGKKAPAGALDFRLTAQGGIGTYAEDVFLRRYYGAISTGWGSPFLLVPEAVQIDKETLDRLAAAGENDIYLSDVSPLNVAFNNLRNSLSEIKRCLLINSGEPGSPCLLGHLANNTEFTKNPICTASRTYQKLKLDAIKALGLSQEEYDRQARKITSKACICAQLGDSFYVNENIPKKEGTAPAVCPGPNIAYFNRPATLKDMIDHIYGRRNIMPFKNRPHMFIKELRLNIDQFEILLADKSDDPGNKRQAVIEEYTRNLNDGIAYYRTLVPLISEEPDTARERFLSELDDCARKVAALCPVKTPTRSA